jgi:hypothetical protein
LIILAYWYPRSENPDLGHPANHRGISRKLDEITAEAGARSVFEARIFDDLCFAAKAAIS